MSEYIDGLLKYLKYFEKKSVNELFNEFAITSNAKSKNFILSQALINSYEGKEIAKTKIERNKINIKTIQLKENGNPKEAMSFAPINFCKIVNENWNESDFKNYLKKDFLFIIFKLENGNNYLYKIIKWSVPLCDLNGEIKLVWEDTKKKVSEGTVIKEVNGKKYITWFMPEKVTNICHVRPHGSNGADVSKLPVTDRLTGYDYALKHSFWFNHSYIKRIVDSN